jgi:hypothetical protein
MEKGVQALFGLPRRMASRIVRHCSPTRRAAMVDWDGSIRTFPLGAICCALRFRMVWSWTYSGIPADRKKGPPCPYSFAVTNSRFDCFGLKRGHFHLALFTLRRSDSTGSNSRNARSPTKSVGQSSRSTGISPITSKEPQFLRSGSFMCIGERAGGSVECRIQNARVPARTAGAERPQMSHPHLELHPFRYRDPRTGQ